MSLVRGPLRGRFLMTATGELVSVPKVVSDCYGVEIEYTQQLDRCEDDGRSVEVIRAGAAKGKDS